MIDNETNDIKYISLVVAFVLVTLICDITVYKMYKNYVFTKNGYTQEILPGSQYPRWVLPKR